MNTDRAATLEFQRIRETFDSIIELPESEQRQRLRDARLSDEEREQVSRLLAGHAKHRLFEVAAVDWANQLEGDDYLDAMIGRHIGACELVRLVGRGGSSIVFLARRRVGGALQDVALKLLNNGLTSPEAHRRFRREQAILSRLSHPNVARLIDAGISDSGNPFIVMEYVEGQDIVAYALAKSLDLRTRIGLLIDVCRAVDAAHRALVVHRDLKPSNVFVTTDGTIKVLDFGIAKMLDDDHPETATQHVALTPAYAAPEQFSPGPAATSMDVYSIGVLSSEVLLGGRLGADATLPPNETSDTWQRWRRVDNDLSQILRAALASEPARRYSSAGHMADDFQRYLDREPLLIMPVSRWYRIRKFASRHRAAVSAAALFGLAVFAGTIGIAYQWRIARQQAALAREQAVIARDEATRAGAIRDFLVSLFDAGNADMPQDKKPSVEDIVADAGQRLLVDDKIAGSLRSDLLLTLADVASSIGAYDRSDGFLDEVERIAPTLGNAAEEAALQVRVRRAGSLLEQTTTKGTQALDLLEPILPVLRSRADDIGFKGLTYHVKALQIAGRDTDAEAELRPLVARYRSAPNAALALSAILIQINVAVGAQHYPEAVEYARAAEDFWIAHGRPQTPTTLSIWADIAIAREGVGDIAGAEEAYRTAIAIGDRIYAHPTLDHANVVQIYGTFLIVQSRVDEAEVQVRRALQMEQSLLGEDDPRIAQAVYAMARLYGARRDFAEAIRWLDKAIALYRKDGRSTMLARSLAARGRFHAEAGQLADAERDVRDALEHQKNLSGDSTPAYAWILDVLAELQLREHRYEEALRTTNRIIAITSPKGGAMMQMNLSTRYKRARAFDALERPSEALAELEDIEPAFTRVAPKAPVRFDIAALKAIALAKVSRSSEAHEAAKAALELAPLNRGAEPSILARVRALAVDIGHEAHR